MSTFSMWRRSGRNISTTSMTMLPSSWKVERTVEVERLKREIQAPVLTPMEAQRLKREIRRLHLRIKSQDQAEAPTKSNECGERTVTKEIILRTLMIVAISTLAKWSGCFGPRALEQSDCLYESCTPDGGARQQNK